ncbi:hypothetical protein ACQKGI_19935 [Peribacillus muralis]|uniref:hypothetical protein n=1 Tax=Peribacillus muralis TaxID=264697 RepID=UPI0038002D81
MRFVDKSFVVTKEIQLTIRAVTEEVEEINENKTNRMVVCKVVFKDMEGEMVISELHIIEHEYYDLLMSTDDMFTVDKPLNEYRLIDLFKVVDKMREDRENTSTDEEQG